MRLGLSFFILSCVFATALCDDSTSTTTESTSTTTTESTSTTTTTTTTTTVSGGTTTTVSGGTTTTVSGGTTTTVSGGTTTTVSGGTATTVSGGTTITVSGGTTTTGPTTTTITTTSTTTTSAAQALIRKTAWLVGDPHLYSVKNNYQFCNFTGSVNCLSTTGLSIGCTATNVKSGTPVTYLSALSLTFTNGSSITYTASDPTVALTDKFSDGKSTVLSSANTTWLVITMLTNTSKSSSVSIVDYQTNTTIVISQWRNSASSPITYKMYNLIVRMTSKDFSTSTGILINGCPTPSRRRRRSLSSLTDQERDASDSCAGMSNSGDINSADICVADTTATGESSFADATAIAAQSIQSAVSIDASVFSAGVSSFNLGVNLGLFSIALNIFLFFY